MVNPNRTQFRPDLVVADIYDAALNPDSWVDVVEKIRLGFHGCSAQFHSPGTPLEQGGVRVSAQWNDGDAAHYWKACNELGHVWNDIWSDQGKPEVCFTGDALLNRTEFKRSPIFNEFFRPRDIHNSCMGVLHNGQNGMPLTVFGVNRGPRADPFSIAEQRSITVLLPHLRRAFHLGRELAAERSKFSASTALLERSSAAIAIVARNQRILYLTPKAQTLLAAGDGLTSRGGRLAACAASDSVVLERILGNTCARNAGLTAGGVVAVQRPSVRRPYWVTVLPVAADTLADISPDGAAAIVTIQTGEERPVAPLAHLAERFGLTQAEAGVLHCLFEGNTPAEISERLGITVPTVRMHLAHLFAKTGTKRQADLVRLALSSLASIDLTP
jgi:DNA-binding CsgD family transcriptional regulator